jgi:hypothetical protein
MTQIHHEPGTDWREGLADDVALTSLFDSKESYLWTGTWSLNWQEADDLDKARGKGKYYLPPAPGGGGPRIFARASTPPPPVLIPGRDALNIGTSGNIDTLTSFIFEDLAGTEIITLLRRDTIDGIDPNYSIISNISEVRRNIDPTKLISKVMRGSSYFDQFTIRLIDKIPDDEYLKQNNLEKFYYIASNGDLVIEFDNLLDGEVIEVQIATNGTINELDND